MMRETNYLVPNFSLVLFFTFLIWPSSVSISSVSGTVLPGSANDPPFTTPPAYLTDDASCSTTCASDGSQPSILKYKENESFRYKIEGLTAVHLPNSLKGESVKLNYVANFDISAESKCSFLLKVSNVEIIAPDGKKFIDNSLIGNPAKFSWNNGKLEKLCVDKRESTEATNFKRSIIANLQVSSWGNPISKSPISDSPFYETDVFGRCQVVVESGQEQDGSWIVKKTKDLNSCTFRQGFDFSVKTGSYLSDSSSQTNPFVQATLQSTIKVEKGLIKSVEINENYNYQPLSKYGETLTSAAVTTKMALVGRSKTGIALGSFNPTPASLLYETPKSSEGTATVPVIIKAIQEASREVDGVIPSNGAVEFSKLVAILQQAKKAELLTIYAQVKSGAGFPHKETAMAVFWDALISASTAATTETAAILLMNKEMPSNKVSDFLASLSFVKHPTEETLKALTPLLEEAQVPQDRYLALGALTNRYVLDYPNTNSPELTYLLEKLSSPIKRGCICKTVEQEDLVISSLKALRNAKYLTAEISALVRVCAANPNATTRIRVAALQAMGVNSTDENNKKAALNLFKTTAEDAELRIQALLVYMDSPSSEKAQTVKNLLDVEQSDQVGSYMVSYLRNLQSSEDPKKEIMKQYYGNIKTKRRFPVDFRQISQNYHFSQLLSTFNLGYAVDADVLFSPKSYVPRSTSLSLNSYLFGNSFNLFEMDARFENVEYLLEKYAGPRSYLKTNKAETVADDFSEAVRKFAGDMAQKASLLGRAKRDVDMLPKQAKKKRTPLSSKYMDIDFSMKMFESEILWSAYHTDKTNILNGDYLDSLFRRIEIAIEKAKNMDIDYKKFSRCPIISSNVLNYPTSSGFSLRLSTNANSAVQLKMNGNVDAMKIINSPKSTDVRLLIMPSAIVEVEGILEIDASVISAGLKATSSVRTATGFELGFKVLDGQGYDFKLGLPVKEQDLFTLKTEAFSFMQEKGQSAVETPLKANGKRYEFDRTYDQLAQLTGLSLRTEFDSPTMSFKPSFSPSTYSVRLVKTDEKLQYYNTKFLLNKDANTRSMELLFDTPGSTVDRHVSLSFETNSADKKLTAKLVTPKKKIFLEASGIVKEDEVFCNVKYISDAAEYNMKLGAKVTNENYSTRYKPYVELKMPYDAREASMDKMRLSPRQASQLINIDGEVVLTKKPDSPKYRKYEFQQLTVTSPFGKLSLEGLVQMDCQIPQFNSDLVLAYGDLKNTIKFQSDLNYIKNTTEEKEVAASLAVMPSQWPSYGFKYTFNLNKTATKFERMQTFTHGADLNSDVSKITVKEVLNTVREPQSTRIVTADGNLKVCYPLWKLDIDGGFEQQSYSFYSGHGTLVLDKTNVAVNGSVRLDQKKPGDVEVKLQSKMNEKTLDLDAVRELVNDDESSVKIKLNTNPGKQIDVSMNITHRLRPENIMLKAHSEVNVLPDKQVYRCNMGLMNTPEEKGVYFVLYPNKERSVEVKAGYKRSPSTLSATAVLFFVNNIDGELSFGMKPTKMLGELKMNLPKLNRLITGKMDLNVRNGENYRGYCELLWDASNDASKKFTINTNTMITNENSNITTENTVQIVDYKFQANGSFGINRDLPNGDDVIAKADIILSNGSSFGLNLQRFKRVDESLVNYDLNADGYYSQARNAPPAVKFNYKFAGKDFDFANKMFDVKTEFTLDTSQSKNLKAGLTAQRTLSNDNWTTGGNLYVDGNIVKKKMNLLVTSEYSSRISDPTLLLRDRSLPPASFRVAGNIGDDYVLDNEGRFEKAELKNVLSLKIPQKGGDSLALKWTTNTKVDVIPSKYINLRTTNQIIWNGDKFMNCEGHFETTPKNGKLSLAWDSSDMARRSLDLTYGYDFTQNTGLLGPYAQASVNLTFNGREANCLFKVEFSKDLSAKQITVSGYSPTSGKFDIQATSKVEDYGQSLYNDFVMTNNQNRWAASSRIDTYPTKPAIDLSYSSPHGDSKLAVKLEERVRNYWSAVADVKWGGEGYLKADGELKLDTVDDILIKAKLDSPTLGVNNFSVAANNRAVEGGKKKLQFIVKMADRSYAGSASYNYRVDAQKLAFEANGSVKIDDKIHPVSFKYNRLQLTEEANGETGSMNKIYVNVDKKKYVLDMEGKFTDKSFFVKRDLWRDDKLYKLDLAYQVKMTDVLNYEKTILSHIDLKPFIPNGEEFVIEGKTTRSLSNYNHHLSLQWAPDKKVEYDVYSTLGKSGFSFTLPQRQIAAETLYAYRMDSTDGSVKIAGTIWFDKARDETQKLLLSVGGEYKIPEDNSSFMMRSIASLQIPTLPKSLTINSRLSLSPFNEKTVDFTSELDLFKKPEQSITVNYQVFKGKKDGGYMISDTLQVVSQGQKMNTEIQKSVLICLDHVTYHFGISYLGYQNKKREATADFDLRLTSVNSKIQIYENITINGKMEIAFGSNYIEIREELDAFGHQYVKTCRFTTDPKIMVTLEWKGAVRQRGEVQIFFVMNQFLKVVAAVNNGKVAGKVASFTLFLDDPKFMQSETEIVIDNAEILLDNGKRDLLSLIDDAKTMSKYVMNEINIQLIFRGQQYREANIDIKPIIESSNKYLTTLRDEIKNDPSIVSASENVKNIVSGVTDFVLVIVQQISSFLGDWVYGYNVLLEKFSEFLEGLVPAINNLLQLSLDDVTVWLREMVNQLGKMSVNVIQYVRANQAKWKETLTSIIQTAKESLKIAHETYEQFSKDAKEFYERVRTYLNSLPITNYLKERFEQLKNSQAAQYAWAYMTDMGNYVKESMPTPELKTLIEMIMSTLDKVANDKPIDTSQEFIKISKQFVAAMRSLGRLIAENANYLRELTDTEYNLPQLSITSFKNIPNLWTASLNAIRWVRNLDFSSMDETLETYKIGSLNLLNLIPPFRKVAVIMDGRHIVTTNGINYELDSDCQYILARDFEYSNFTVVADIRKGSLMSLAVSSNTQTIELYPNTAPSLDKVSKDFPVYGNGVFAIRNPYSIDVHVDDSVFVSCTPSLDVCSVQISGFYQNKVFGLLGSISPETYLDFTMSDMNIAPDLSSFIKSYQVGSKCADVAPPAVAEAVRSAECNEIFSGKSVLRRGFSFIKMKPYRDICDRAVRTRATREEKLEAACKTGLAFSMISYANGYFVTLPPKCSKCTIKDKPLAYGYSEEVTAPGDTADILVLLDLSKNNEAVYNELFLNSMAQIKNSLKQNGISDINFALISYGFNEMYPSLHTTNGQITLNEKTTIEFPKIPQTNPTTDLGKFVKNIKSVLGMYSAQRAFDVANSYPFRPDSVKSIIQIDASTEDSTMFDKHNFFNTIANTVVSWNIISNKIPVFLLTSGESVSNELEKDVFGFDKNGMYTTNGPKSFENGILSRFKLLKTFRGSMLLQLTNKGAIFNSTVFSQADPALRSQLLEMFSNRIVDSLVSYERFSECTCTYKIGMYSEVRCSMIMMKKKS